MATTNRLHTEIQRIRAALDAHVKTNHSQSQSGTKLSVAELHQLLRFEQYLQAQGHDLSQRHDGPPITREDIDGLLAIARRLEAAVATESDPVAVVDIPPTLPLEPTREAPSVRGDDPEWEAFLERNPGLRGLEWR